MRYRPFRVWTDTGDYMISDRLHGTLARKPSGRMIRGNFIVVALWAIRLEARYALAQKA